MSTATKSPNPEPAHHYIVRRTVEACRVAKDAAATAAEGIATGSSSLLRSLRQRERELDTLDMEIDSGVTTAITEVGPAEARLARPLRMGHETDHIAGLVAHAGDVVHRAVGVG